MVKYLPEFEYLTVFKKKNNIIFKIRRSKVTYFAALTSVMPSYVISVDNAVEIVFFVQISI